MGYISSAALHKHDNLAYPTKSWGGYKEYGEIILLSLPSVTKLQYWLAVELAVLKENRQTVMKTLHCLILMFLYVQHSKSSLTLTAVANMVLLAYLHLNTCENITALLLSFV